MNHYVLGNGVRLNGVFAIQGADTDPTTTTFKIERPGGAVTTLVYGVDAALAKDSVGHYHVDYAPATVGVYAYRFQGVGACVAAAEAEFDVPYSPFA